MSNFTLANNISDQLESWDDALKNTLKIPSFKKFLEVTSKHKPVVVINNPKISKFNERNRCHENCRLAELEGLGTRVSGWYIMSKIVYSEYPVGMLRLIHHSNLLLPDGTLVNTTDDEGRAFHLFLKDENRDFDFDKSIGFNDRMVLGDDFLAKSKTMKSVPRNKVLFASESEFDRDLIFEKFTRYKSSEEIFSALPKGLTPKEKQKWLTLKCAQNR